MIPLFKNIAIRTLKWGSILVGIILLLLITVFLLIQTRFGQNLLRDGATSYLSSKLKTKVTIGRIDLDLNRGIRISNFLLEDREHRKLANIGLLDIEINLLPLLAGKVMIPRLLLQDTEINLYREQGNPDFNFSFIPQAFSGSGKEPAPTDTSASSMTIVPGKLELRSIRFLMDDQYGRQKYLVSLGQLQANLSGTDINTMTFRARHIHTRDIRTDVSMWGESGSSTSDSSAGTDMRFFVDTASLTRTIFSMDQKENDLKIRTNAALLTGSSISVDLCNMKATARTLLLDDHSTAFEMTSAPARPTTSSPSPSKPFRFAVDSISITRNAFSYHDNAYPKNTAIKAVDPHHLSLNNINMQIGSTASDGKGYRTVLRSLQAKEASGFTLRQLNGSFVYADSLFQADDMLLQTSLNSISASLKITGLQLANKEGMSLKGVVNTRDLDLNELTLFQPSLTKNKYFLAPASKRYDLNTNFYGTLGDLHIPSISIREGKTSLSANARVKHVIDPQKMVIDLKVNSLQSSRNDLLALLPKGTIKDSLLHYIPERFTVSGTYAGTIENFTTDLKVNTSLGNATLKGTARNITNANNAVYNISSKLDDLDLGKLLEDSSLGKISGTLSAKGRGYDPKTAVATVNASINKAGYKGYQYQGLELNGSLNKGFAEADIVSGDPSLDMDGNISMDLFSETKKLDADINIRNADLYRTGFMKDSLILKGSISGHFPVIRKDRINGDLMITNSRVSYKNRMLEIDSISLTARNRADSQFIDLKLPFADALLYGQYDLQSLPGVARKVVNKYILVGNRDTVFTENISAKLSVQVRLPDSVAGMLVEGLQEVAPFNIDGLVDTRNFNFVMAVAMPRLRYKDIELDSLGIFALTSSVSANRDLVAGMRLGNLRGPSYQLRETEVGLRALNGIVDGNITLRDSSYKPRYNIPFKLTNDPQRPYVQIQDSLLIDRKLWTVDKDNRIYLQPDQLQGTMLAISNGSSRISAKAIGSTLQGLPIEVEITELNISDITNILISDTSLATGTLNAKARVSAFTPLSFEASLNADKLTAMGANLGTLQAAVNNDDTSRLEIRSSLKGEVGSLDLNGYYATSLNEADLALDIHELHVSHLEPFAKKYVTHLDGRMNGRLTVRGPLSNPGIRGSVEADSVEAIYAMTATFLRIPKATWTFSEKGVEFNQVGLEDSLGHKGTLNGIVNTSDFSNIAMDLTLQAEDFEVVGRKKIADQGIYGPTRADLNIRLNGSTEHMNLEGKVNIRDNSEFTYVYRSETADQIGEGLVEFFDPSAPVDSSAIKNGGGKKSSTVDMNLYINITPASTITVITDEVSGDHLKAKGKADLNYVMKAGVRELLGTYVLEGGEYDLSLAGLVRRSFKIENGSTINWSGDPMKGRMDITAKYQLRAAAGPLLNDINHIPGIDKQKLNFDVMINLKKELLKPDISFKLDMPETEQQAFDGVVYARVKQVNAIPAELNKQVMGLLAFGQFIAENPFNSLTSAGGDFQSQAFNTAGKLLTQELTNLVGRYVKEVNIDFGLETEKDYTSGKEVQRTDFKVGVSKSFANNRLNVYVGSNFALEGTNQSQDALSGLAGDVTLEYLLTPDAKYRLKGYRLTDNELVFQGNVVRTGLSFVVVLEFNKFKNMFRSTGKKKKNNMKA